MNDEDYRLGDDSPPLWLGAGLLAIALSAGVLVGLLLA